MSDAPAQKPWEHAKSSGSQSDPLAARFVSSLDHDKRLYKHDIRGSIAHAKMLQHVGLITKEELAEIERGLNEIESEIDASGDAWPGWKVELEDVHMCIEAALIEKTGDAGRKLHTGRSRNDQVATDLLTWLVEAAQLFCMKLGDFVEACHEVAEEQGHVVMPSYTHLQRAQPIVVGAELLAWAQALEECGERFGSLSNDAGSRYGCPLGSGAIAGSSLPLNRDITALSLLYSESFGRNSLFATAARDAALDFVYALAMTAMWLSRWAEQWIIYASAEFGFITLDEKYTTGSSMMPQKRNPDMLELIRGKTGQVYGSLVALLTICKGLTIGYNRDLQEDKRHVFAAYDTVCDCLEMAARIVRTTTFNEQRIAETLDKGYLDATSLAEYLVTKGVPFRTAHQAVGRLVQTCEKQGPGRLDKLSVQQIKKVVDELCGQGKIEVDRDVYDWLGPANVVKRYQTLGNAGVTGFEQQLRQWKQRLDGGSA